MKFTLFWLRVHLETGATFDETLSALSGHGHEPNRCAR